MYRYSSYYSPVHTPISTRLLIPYSQMHNHRVSSFNFSTHIFNIHSFIHQYNTHIYKSFFCMLVFHIRTRVCTRTQDKYSCVHNPTQHLLQCILPLTHRHSWKPRDWDTCIERCGSQTKEIRCWEWMPGGVVKILAKIGWIHQNKVGGRGEGEGSVRNMHWLEGWRRETKNERRKNEKKINEAHEEWKQR